MFLRKLVKEAAIGVGIADAPDALSAIHHPGCAATIWRRQPTASFQSWIDNLPPDQLPKMRGILQPHNVRDTVSEVCDLAGTPHCPSRQELIDDVTALAKTFAELISARWLRLRLDVVTTNACRKFHIDAITARLVCTYRGTGTQYGVSTDSQDPARVFTVPTGSPMVMRGTRWPGGQPSGLLHRSPPIEGTGEVRLMLVLDPVDDPEDEI